MRDEPAPSTGSAEGAEAFERLLVPLLGRAYGTALRLTGNPAEAEDLVQDASLLALRGFGGFRPGSNFRAWFFRILVNRFYSNYRRSRRRGATVDLEEAPDGYLLERARAAGLSGGAGQTAADPADAVLARIDAGLAQDALDALPDDFRTVSALYFMDDLSYQEIAEVLDVPIGTVRSRLHRARRLLHGALWAIAEDRGLVPTPAPEGDA